MDVLPQMKTDQPPAAVSKGLRISMSLGLYQVAEGNVRFRFTGLIGDGNVHFRIGRELDYQPITPIPLV
jgi:hypothetical protein